MVDNPIKAYSKENSKGSFYVIQSNGNDLRYVISLNDIIKVKALIYSFIDKSKKYIQIKIRDFTNKDKPKVFTGEIIKKRLLKIIIKHKEFIFHNGFHDLMLRNPETLDYIAFDEHGLIFIYTKKDYSEILEGFNIKFQPKSKLIYEFNHWHYSSTDSEQKLLKLVFDLGLKPENKK